MTVNEFRKSLHDLISEAYEGKKMDTAMIFGIMTASTRAIGVVFDLELTAPEKSEKGEENA